MKPRKYSIRSTLFLLALSSLFLSFYLRCSLPPGILLVGGYVYNEETRDPGPTWDPIYLVAALLLQNQESIPLTTLVPGSPMTDSVAAGGWKYFRISSTSGFYDVTLTDADGAGVNNPDLYVAYLGTIPTQNTADTGWASSDTSTNTTTTIANYYMDNGVDRIVGVYGAAGSGSISFTIQVDYRAAMPLGCGWTMQNTSPYIVGSNTGSQAFTVPSGGQNLYYYLVINNSASTRSMTASLLLNITPTTDDNGSIIFYQTPQDCSSASVGSTTSCTSNCNPAETLNATWTMKPGDFHVVRATVADTGSFGTVNGNYTLSIVSP